MSNLKQLGVASWAYSADHDDNIPPSLDALVEENYIGDDRVFRCPSGHGPGPHYAYIGAIPPELAQNLGPNTIIAYDFAGNHGGGRNVLFHDGHVRWMHEFTFQEELANARLQAEEAFDAAEISIPEPMRAFLNDEVER